MNRLLLAICLLLVGSACGSDGDPGASLPVGDAAEVAGATCLAGDPDCDDLGDGGGAPELPEAVALGDPLDPDAPLLISFGGFFYSNGEQSQLCSALAESFPPQCASKVIDIEAPLDVVLEHVAESFGNPDDAKINIDQGIYWTDDWVNLSGVLEANRLLLGG